MQLKVGDPAPAFTGKTTDGSTVSLADFAGRKLVLYFYPKDDTPGCTKQACSLRDHNQEIRAQGAEILGVSTQDEASHQRFTEKYADAEATFKKYIELLPNDPNPYDSYAELLMKMGRFQDSIKAYEKALAVDKNFVASYVGIGNDHMFMGHGAEARAAFARLTAVARTDGEKRQALFWNAVSYLHEGAYDKALGEAQKEYAIAEASGDLVNLSADVAFMGNILLAAGKPDQAAAKFKQQQDIMAKADAPAEVKAQAVRNGLASDARVALAKKDLATARAKVDAYGKAVAEKKNTFELWQWHELAGMVALEDKKFDVAVSELDQANQQDPRVLYHLAVALDKKGDKARARTVIEKAADFNGLGVNYAYVRKLAKSLKAKIA